ncbi:HAD-IIB family hydrolase [Sorangium sp. So ce131]|uniref:HAD-IIB family hydrolase n=1 Tax=Sorangium sp. So ce131 TaxID=3133282 RepID=UPI003F623C20
MTTYKLFAIDVDGTLVRRDGSIHDEDLLAIARLQAAGVPVSIATGRLYSGTRDVARRVGVIGPIACVDGSHIVHTDGDAHLYSRTISGNEAALLRSITERHATACFLFAQDSIVHDASGTPHVHYVRGWSHAIAEVERVSSHPYWEHDHGLLALVAVGTEPQIAAAVEEIRSELGQAASVVSFPFMNDGRTNVFAMMVRAAGSTKGTAITWLAEHYGCTPSDVVVVGDWLNDVPMFEVAGRSFVMGQAPENVKQAATDRLEADGLRGGGIAEAIYRAFGR